MAATSLQKGTTRVITKGYSTIKMPATWLSLPLIMVFQGIISLITLHNTAFQDEALYLFAGRQILNGWLGLPHVQVSWAYFISGYPYIYPLIGGELNTLGGLELARLFSLLCMMGVTSCVYYVTRHLFDQKSAILAAALFAFQGPVLFLGRLATFDAMCLLLLALALVLALYVSTARSPWPILFIGPLLILAALTKYLGLIFVPIPLAILIFRTPESQGWRKMFVRLGMALCSVAVAAVVAYVILDKDALHGIIYSTTNRDVTLSTAPLDLVQFILTLSGIGFALGLLGLLLSGRRRLLMRLLLFGSSLLVPAYHIHAGELISLHKHLAFSMFYIMPLAGYAVARIAHYRPNVPLDRYWLAGLAVCLITFSSGVQQAQNLYGEWAPSDKLINALRTQVRFASGRYLAEDTDVCRYYLQDETALWQWNNLDFFEYTDKEGHYLTDRPAYHAAIQEGYFDLVELSYGFNADLAVFIDQQLKASKNYRLIVRIPFSNSYGTGYYWIWGKM